MFYRRSSMRIKLDVRHQLKKDCWLHNEKANQNKGATKTSITSVHCICADGSALPPAFLF